MHPTDQIESYLADGLPPLDRSAFEAHIAACPACAALVDEARAVDADLTDLFAEIRPSADFEDRIVESLVLPRLQSARPIGDPMFGKWAGGIAALLIVGIIGLMATSILGHKTSAMVGTLAAILPGNESNDSGPVTSGSLIETTNSDGTISINASPSEDMTNTDRLDGNTGLQSGDAGTTSLTLDIDSDEVGSTPPKSPQTHLNALQPAVTPAIADASATPKSNPGGGVTGNTAADNPNKTPLSVTTGGFHSRSLISKCVIIGLCVVAPLGLLIWAGRRLLKKRPVRR